MSSCPDSEHCRSPQEIITGCVATLVMCAWLVIHPGLPGVKEKPLEVVTRRVGLFLMAAIVPDFVALWSVRQWLLAGKIAAEFELEGWSRSHGFFALMGGSVAYDGRRVIRPLFFDPSQQEDLELPETTLEDIEDRSKSNFFTRFVVALQITWFILQCIARKAGGFEIAVPELVVLGYVVLNTATFVFWWNKPVDIRQPIRIRVPKGWQSPWNPHQAPEPTPFWFRIPDILVGSFVRMARGDHEAIRGSRISTFYPELASPRDLIWFTCIGACLATIFGAIHCIAWSLDFGSGIARLLWHVGSLIITCTPSLIFLLVVLLSSLEANVGCLDGSGVLLMGTIVLIYILGLVYLLARGILLAVTVWTLTSLPPSVFQTVPWTRFLPHWS